MKIFVSTRLTQGRRKNDFCNVPEGEVVGFTSECDGEAIDGKCGCRRSMCGLESRTATTTMKVIDIPLSLKGLEKMVHKGLLTSGWVQDSKDPKGRKWASEDAEELAAIARSFPVGAIVEKRGNKFRIRAEGLD